MPDHEERASRRSDVAMWHERGDLPDNVTDEGLIVAAQPGERLSTEKTLLRGAIARLSENRAPDEVRSLARLAASYLVAGDVETAGRYVERAERLMRDAGATSPDE